MAFFCEKETVLRLFRDGVDAYYQQSKYEVGETVQTSSPPKEGKLPYSRSLEHYTSLLTGDKKTNADTTQQVNEKKNNTQIPKCETITFDSKTTKGFNFVKKPIPSQCSTVSELSKNIVPIKFIEFKVYFPKKCEPFFVLVRHPETANISTIMKSAILQYNDKSSNPLSVDISAYKFYIAEDDGSPEEFGILGAAQIAARMGKEFTLVPEREGGIRPPSMDRTSLVIRLPQKEKATIRFDISMKSSDIIQRVCNKRNWNSADYHLETEEGPLSYDISVQDIQSLDTLELVPNVVETGDSDSPNISNTSFHDTFKYKVFEIKHKGKSANLGIDGEYVQIIKKRTGFTREKKDVHPFAEVTIISIGKGNKEFSITWADGKKELFESNYRKEIISKIEAIQQRKRDSFF